MSGEQQFLITVQRMCIDAYENQIVASWSAVVDESNLDHVQLSIAAKLTAETLSGAPSKGLRSMTLDEVNAWRAAEAQNF